MCCFIPILSYDLRGESKLGQALQMSPLRRADPRMQGGLRRTPSLSLHVRCARSERSFVTRRRVIGSCARSHPLAQNKWYAPVGHGCGRHQLWSMSRNSVKPWPAFVGVGISRHTSPWPSLAQALGPIWARLAPVPTEVGSSSTGSRPIWANWIPKRSAKVGPESARLGSMWATLMRKQRRCNTMLKPRLLQTSTNALKRNHFPVRFRGEDECRRGGGFGAAGGA